jgi:predicted SAM-dependent methyltransferase
LDLLKGGRGIDLWLGFYDRVLDTPAGCKRNNVVLRNNVFMEAFNILDSEQKCIISLFKQYVGGKGREFLYLFRFGHIFRKRKIKNYLNKYTHAKLHLGSGSRKLKGFLNSDIYGTLPVNITKKLPFNDCQFELIYSSHVIEHIHKREFKRFLKESYRILKPGGINIIATPTIENIARFWYCCDQIDSEMLEIMRDRYSKFMDENCFTPSQLINHMMRNYGHKYLYDRHFMQELGKEAGYSVIKDIPNFDVPDAEIKKYLVANKPRRWDIITETFLFIKNNN